MNKRRRDELGKAIKSIETIKEVIERIKSEEEDAADNIPENLQGGIAYEAAMSAVDCLCDAVESLDNAIEYVNEAVV